MNKNSKKFKKLNKSDKSDKFDKSGKINKKISTRISAVCLTTVIALAGIPFVPVSARTAPTLNLKTVTVEAEDLTNSRTIGIDLSVCENTEGFRAASFGIRYDENLSYIGMKAMTVTGEAFQLFDNPEEHVLWLNASSKKSESVACSLQDETIIMLYFDIAKTTKDGMEINGGDFPIEFLWTGLDDSEAFWYTDTQTNDIDNMRENSLNGKISFFNPDSEIMSESSVRISAGFEHQLEILNASGEILWFSSDDSVATVDEDGLVTAVAPGECQIQAFINEHLMSCDVTVTSEVYHLISDNGAVNITDQTTIHVMEYPDALSTVTWISVKPGVVSIDPDGTMHAVSNGIANILGTYNGKTLMRIVNVNLDSADPGTEPTADLPTEPETTTAPETEPTTETTEPSGTSGFLGKPKSGDINGNGTTDIADVVLCNRICVGVEQATQEQITAGDMDGSGKLDLSDSMTILRMLVGLIPFPET